MIIAHYYGGRAVMKPFINLPSRQARPIVWDFCESRPSSQAREIFLSGLSAAVEVSSFLIAR